MRIELARVDALVDRDVAHCADHVLVGDCEHRPGRPLDAEPKRLGDDRSIALRAASASRVSLPPRK